MRRRPSSFRVVNRKASVLYSNQTRNDSTRNEGGAGEVEVYRQLFTQLDSNNSQATLIRALNSVYEISGGDVNNGNPRDQTRDDLYKHGIGDAVVNLLDASSDEYPTVIKNCCKVLRNLARNDSINDHLGSELNLCIRILSLFNNQLNPTDNGECNAYMTICLFVCLFVCLYLFV